MRVARRPPRHVWAIRGLDAGLWSQLNSWGYGDLPWVDEECAVSAFRAYAELRYRLAPCLYSTAAEAARTGYPIARHLSHVCPETAEYDGCVDT